MILPSVYSSLYLFSLSLSLFLGGETSSAATEFLRVVRDGAELASAVKDLWTASSDVAIYESGTTRVWGILGLCVVCFVILAYAYNRLRSWCTGHQYSEAALNGWAGLTILAADRIYEQDHLSAIDIRWSAWGRIGGQSGPVGQYWNRLGRHLKAHPWNPLRKKAALQAQRKTWWLPLW